jgi:DNA-binding transcriptional regulator LsrR (DeoR family)
VTIIHAEGAEAFAREAAGLILELTVFSADVQLVGILYGRTIESVVSEIEKMEVSMHRPCRAPMMFVPLCGEPLYLENLENLRHSASALAARLHAAINDLALAGSPSSPRSPSLAGVPLYLSPRRRGASDVATIRRFLAGIPGYAAIFGAGTEKHAADPPLAGLLDAVITGLGTVNEEQPEYSGAFLRERVAQGAATLEVLNSLVYGDIGGVLLPRPGIGRDGESRVRNLNRGLMGIGRDGLRSVARKPQKPGTIVIATGGKAEVARAAVAQGFVTHLIVSSDLADELIRLP